MKKAQKSSQTYTFNFVNNSGGRLFDVEEGQTLLISWDCPDGNLNGWVLNGNGLTDDIRQLRTVGTSGNAVREVRGTGQVRVGSNTSGTTFAIRNGTVIITVEYPN